MVWTPTGDAWLAGFADGEGCFYIRTDLAPAFKIALRADDLQILETLRSTLGGSLRIRTTDRWLGGDANRRPQGELTISSKRDLARLVGYFDRFPLRAKKARDYAIWRRAVLAFCARGRHGAADELAVLREALTAVRAYEGPEPLETPAPPQLRLAEAG